MPQTEHLTNSIFQIRNNIEFNDIALEIFHFQIENNLLYRSFVKNCSIDIHQINQYQQIPFLPIEFYKSHKVMVGHFIPEAIFTSSGTTGTSTNILLNILSCTVIVF